MFGLQSLRALRRNFLNPSFLLFCFFVFWASGLFEPFLGFWTSSQPRASSGWASVPLPSFFRPRTSSEPFLGFWTSSQPLPGLGPLRVVFWTFLAFSRAFQAGLLDSTLLDLFFRASRLFGLGSGPLPGLFSVFSSSLLDLFPVPGLFLGFWTSSQPLGPVALLGHFLGF